MKGFLVRNESMNDEIIERLEKFNLEGNYIERLGKITDAVLLNDYPETALPAMFDVLERYPEEELGSPGPLVHAIEKCRGYEEILLESLGRQPGTLTVWMLHRLIKYDPKPRYLETLRAVISHPKVSEQTKEDAQVILSWVKSA